MTKQLRSLRSMSRQRGKNYLTKDEIAVLRKCYVDRDKAIVAATLVGVSDRTAYKYYSQFEALGVKRRGSPIKIGYDRYGN